MIHSDLDPSSRQVADDAAETIPSRRRPGRRNDVHPSLIPLLRGEVTADDPALMPAMSPEGYDLSLEDDLTPARSVILAVAVSVPAWAAVISVVWYLVG